MTGQPRQAGVSGPESLLALHHAPGMTNRIRCTLLDRHGCAEAVCAASRDELGDAGLGSEALDFLRAPGGERFERDLRWCRTRGNTLLCRTDTRYPGQLLEIGRPPALLFVTGAVDLLTEPQVAVVGSRRPTPGGIRNARYLADGLARSGLVVVSGLAAGIDAQAHSAALDVQAPTVAVIGTGSDRVYPAENRALSRSIADHGAIISEFSCGTPPHAANFPRRNRLMSGLSLGVLVIEAGDRSGTLITARLAGEQNREVFAVPGSIRNPMARGCHRLIQQGAKLVQSVEDILIEISSMVDLHSLNSESRESVSDVVEDSSLVDSDAAQWQLLEHMAYDEPLGVDVLVERSGLTASEVSSMLLSLEIEGWVAHDCDLYTRMK